MSEHAKRIRAGLERLEGGEKWVKGQLFERKYTFDGNGDIIGYCMIGSVVVDDYTNLECVNDALPTLRIIAEVILEQHPDVRHDMIIEDGALCTGIPLIISSFNDSCNRSFVDVERIMEKAAIKAEEMV